MGHVNIESTMQKPARVKRPINCPQPTDKVFAPCSQSTKKPMCYDVSLSAMPLSVQQQKTLRAIVQRRTGSLGGRVDACNECGNISISYNSCRNRHCPKCQGHKREAWIQKREAELLPCTYYHVVFTCQRSWNPPSCGSQNWCNDTLFASV